MPPEVLFSARVGVGMGGVLMQHMSQDRREEIVPLDGALEQLRRLIGTFGAGNVRIISYMGARMATHYAHQLAQPGGFLQLAGMDASNLHIIQDRDKFACLKSLHIEYFIDDSVSVVEPLLLETDRRADLQETHAGLYPGPLLCVLVPTVRAGNVVDPIERHRHYVAQHRGGRLVLAAGLTEAVTRIIEHSTSEAR